jgi:hypothetical protein
MRVAEVAGFEGVGRGVMGLLRLWKCVEKWEKRVSSEQWVVSSANENTMKKKREKRARRDELRKEYDLTTLKGGVHGKYAERYRAGTNLVLLSPDVAEHFPGEQSVDTALRGLIRGAKGRSPGAR